MNGTNPLPVDPPPVPVPDPAPLPPITPLPPAPPVAPKPGYLTTEFWSMFFTNLISAVTGVSVLLGKSIDTHPLLALVPMASFLAMAIATAYYAHSRGQAKAAALAADAQVISTAMSIEHNRQVVNSDFALAIVKERTSRNLAAAAQMEKVFAETPPAPAKRAAKRSVGAKR